VKDKSSNFETIPPQELYGENRVVPLKKTYPLCLNWECFRIYRREGIKTASNTAWYKCNDHKETCEHCGHAIMYGPVHNEKIRKDIHTRRANGKSCLQYPQHKR